MSGAKAVSSALRRRLPGAPYPPERSPHSPERSPHPPERSPHPPERAPYPPERSPLQDFSAGARRVSRTSSWDAGCASCVPVAVSFPSPSLSRPPCAVQRGGVCFPFSPTLPSSPFNRQHRTKLNEKTRPTNHPPHATNAPRPGRPRAGTGPASARS